MGQVFGQRYEVTEKLGAGGMAQVYKGKDTILGRFVTIKVLREELLADELLVKRFYSEAQSVARLSHPNIVSIYDVGEEDGKPYLVMEYVEGRSLKEVIREKKKLPYQEAVGIAIQVCRALAHAHEHDIVHRDIKPQNILLTPGGQVKVTDFGIARSTASTTLTYNGSIVGSIHYLSPEQAQGQPADARSDIYSLGVVMYEMVTGRLPFEGDSGIAIALKHLQEEPVPPRNYAPDLPKDLEKVILRTLRKDPDARPQDARDLARQLERFTAAGPDATQEIPVVTPRRKLRPWAKVAIIMGALALFAIAFLLGSSILAVKETTVPDVYNQPVEQAFAKIQEAGLKPVIAGERNHDTIPKGYVISQDPAANKKVKRGQTVSLEISSGPALVTVPPVRGLSVRDAELQILNAGLTVDPNHNEVYDPDWPKGVVIAQDPEAGQQVSKGTPVRLTVSLGPRSQPIKAPDLRGMTVEQAKQRCEELGLNLGSISFEENYEYFSGQIVRQDVEPQAPVPKGQTINVIVSKGPGPPPQTAEVTYEVPKDGRDHVVKIVVIDATGQREELKDTRVASGTKIKRSVTFYREGIVQVYLDGVVVAEKKVP